MRGWLFRALVRVSSRMQKVLGHEHDRRRRRSRRRRLSSCVPPHPHPRHRHLRRRCVVEPEPYYRNMEKRCVPCTEFEFHYIIAVVVAVLVTIIGSALYYNKASIQRVYDRNKEAILVAKNHGNVAMITMQVNPLDGTF